MELGVAKQAAEYATQECKNMQVQLAAIETERQRHADASSQTAGNALN